MRHTIGHILIIVGMTGLVVCRILSWVDKRALRYIHREELKIAYENIRKIEEKTVEINSETESIREEIRRVKGV